MKKNKYAATYGSYTDCPSCMGPYGSHLSFFGSFKEMLETALKYKNEREYDNVYSVKTGRKLGWFDTECASHRVVALHLTLETRAGQAHKYRTIDDGHGVQIWARK